MRYLSLITLLMMMSCQQKSTNVENPDAEKVQADPAKNQHNQLTDQQKADGWELLFDGQTKTGWRVFKGKENNSWEVVDGTLHCMSFEVKKTDKRADLITEKEFTDFELLFDWKIQKQSNSGVMFHVSEDYNEPYASGPEYQILDDAAYSDVNETNFTGCLYGMYATTSGKKLNPAGEWNHSKLIVNNNRVEHWLNDERVLSYEINSADWKKVRDASKWKDFPGYAAASKGYIDLQDHGNEIWFRDIMIKPL